MKNNILLLVQTLMSVIGAVAVCLMWSTSMDSTSAIQNEAKFWLSGFAFGVIFLITIKAKGRS